MTSQLRGLLDRFRHDPVVVLSGAGTSSESGIPTFRGAEGYWTAGSANYLPTDLATRRAFEEMPDVVWSWTLHMRSVCNAAQPNAAHLALAEIEKMLGQRFLLITQNVDELHRRAGNSRILEIHGNANLMRCWKTCRPGTFPIPSTIASKARGENLSDLEKALLVCPHCSGPARPHMLWFDECYDEEHYGYDSAIEAVKRARAFITVGSSGATNLPQRLANLASGGKAVMIDINLETNRFAQLAQASGGIWLRSSASGGLCDLRDLLAEASRKKSVPA